MYALSFPNHHLQYKILHNFFVLQTMNIAEALLETGLYILVVLNPAFPFQILSHSKKYVHYEMKKRKLKIHQLDRN